MFRTVMLGIAGIRLDGLNDAGTGRSVAHGRRRPRFDF